MNLRRILAGAVLLLGLPLAAQAQDDDAVFLVAHPMFRDLDYRQTVLTAFREVEDNLSSLRILGDEAVVQQQALAAARQSVELTTNQYKAGLVGFLNVVVVQAQAFAAERNAIDLAGRRLAASVALVKALGGPYKSPA